MPALLAVDDDAAILRGIKRLLPEWTVWTATSAEEARLRLSSVADWAGFLLDVNLGDMHYGGLDLLRSVRTVLPLVPAALVTGTIEHRVINAAATLGATVVAKPAGRAELGPFLRRAEEATRVSAHASELAAAAQDHYRLDPGEASVVWWVAAGNEVGTYGAHAGMSTVVVADLARGILKKSGLSDIKTVVAQVACHRAADAANSARKIALHPVK
jgi:CheY-like chemotaxis protein